MALLREMRRTIPRRHCSSCVLHLFNAFPQYVHTLIAFVLVFLLVFVSVLVLVQLRVVVVVVVPVVAVGAGSLVLLVFEY